MKHRIAAFVFAGLAAINPVVGAACTLGTTLPSLPGRVVFQHKEGSDLICDPNSNDTDTATTLYVYDFASSDPQAKPMLVPTAAWNLHCPTNPVFSPDGSAVVFRAVRINQVGDGQSDIYFWQIGGEMVINLTGADLSGADNNNNQDVKFSPDGSIMVWKRLSGLAVANFSLDASAQPKISTPNTLVAGSRGTQSEVSGPVFSPDQQSIYYFQGSNNARPQQVSRYSVGSMTTGAAFSQASGSYYYYPIVDYTASRLFYVSGPVGIGPDSIFYFANANAVSGSPTQWSPGDTSDNSDPAAVDGDYFLFSHDKNSDGNSGYELYLGRLSTSQCWRVAPVNSFFSAGGQLGSSYTTVRPASTPWSLGGPNYSAGSGKPPRPW